MLTQEEIGVLQTHKIPVSRGYRAEFSLFCFRQNPVIALDIDSAMPTQEELQLIRDYLRSVVRKEYDDKEAERILKESSMPTVSSYNSIILLKGNHWAPNGESGWSYRQITWASGPRFIPTYDCSPLPPWTLAQVFEHISPGWQLSQET